MFSTLVEWLRVESRELSRVVVALRTELSLGTGEEELNTSLAETTAAPDLEEQQNIILMVSEG